MNLVEKMLAKQLSIYVRLRYQPFLSIWWLFENSANHNKTLQLLLLEHLKVTAHYIKDKRWQQLFLAY